MTNEQKKDARALAQRGFKAKDIVDILDCSPSTARRYVAVFGPKKDLTK